MFIILKVGGELGWSSWSINQIHIVAEGCGRLFYRQTLYIWHKGTITTTYFLSGWVMPDVF